MCESSFAGVCVCEVCVSACGSCFVVVHVEVFSLALYCTILYCSAPSALIAEGVAGYV